ncbi:MAG: DUF2914 domain-containing protein [Betaproteobacteria bacterium]
MVGRVDAWHMIAQQLAYLVVVSAALLQMLAESPEAPRSPRYVAIRSAALHFLLGTLLNIYVIFYFKSSSFLASFAFLAVVAALLLANESKRLTALGLGFKFALLALCWLSFAAVLVPVLVGSIGPGVFLLSTLAGCVPLALAGAFARRRREMLVPLGLVLIGFLGFYLARLTPPVPLSIPFMGVYHAVERAGQDFRLSHERPAWRIWHHGDQWFRAQPGDRVHVYFRVFSPTRFSDLVVMRWYRKDDAWVQTDAIPIAIVGGRDAGFRGHGFKSNWQPGRWKVQVETTDAREIGRIYFSIEQAPPGPRSFQIVVD